MKIGKLDIGRRAILAPMAEVTDAPFRTICRLQGAGLTFTQMVSAKGLLENSFESLRYLAFARDEKPIGVQLLGGDMEYLGKAAAEVSRLKPDLIDLNCGCSVAQVCKYNMGAALLDDPVQLGKIIARMVRSAGEVPVSVKIRIGRSRQKINVLENARQIEQNGASAIIIHARARSDAYSDSPDWNWIRKVKENVSIPVIGNGSLLEPQDCLDMISQTGCDSLFIARGALGNPFIFNRLNSLLERGADPGHPSADEVLKVCLQHLNLIIRDNGELQGVKKARKHLIWYYRFFDGITPFIEKLFSLDSRSSLEEFLAEHTDKIMRGQYPEEDPETIKKKFNERVLFWMNNQQQNAY